MHARNLAVGPLSEELVFRACVIPLLREARFSLAFTVGVSPLFFGLAHLHHLHRRVLHDKVPIPHALAATALQLAYTSLFGAFAAFLFLRTSHLAAITVCHAYCNHMGLPDFDFLYPESVDAAPSARERDAAVALHRRRRLLVGLHLAGILLFTLALGPLTDPAIYGSFHWPPRRR
mmetsp:Transcript_25824/g.79460  ORF Transcript_25824/g.79460 Transcript_25824/m.79460 type:complete len:176 (+) Transcript_25824:327-854(+)